MLAAVRWSAVVGLVMLCGVAGSAADEVVASLSAAHAERDTSSPLIEIWKADRKLELRQGEAVLRQFRVVLGGQPRFGKERQGDERTPVGRYYIAEKNPDSKFHRFLGISYPNIDDAERGYQRKWIDAHEWADIFFANLRGDEPPWRTPLGGKVGIHGFGSRPFLPIDWTAGCIAVSDEDIEFIYDHVPIGTAVIINE